METICWIHETTEETTEKSTVCFECKHAYPDDDAIIAAWIEMWANQYNMTVEQAKADLQARNRLSLDDITFCPLCLHDW